VVDPAEGILILIQKKLKLDQSGPICFVVCQADLFQLFDERIFILNPSLSAGGWMKCLKLYLGAVGR